MPPRTLLIVDDHTGFRRAVRRVFDGPGYEVTGEAADGAAALAAVEQLHPDVVLLDIQLPDEDGFEVARRIAALPAPPQVVLVSTRSRAVYADRLASCPVRGFIPKADLSGPALAALISPDE
jgi:DNA-binding NarL/FixJ family response regulator